ncbi:MAG TPA: dihydropteroate synthase [Chitinophagaceae bacterium]|jgi:dihydropteroate synthase|nr:dihydropteroate synthase [Chitinophagaceae bacterium]
MKTKSTVLSQTFSINTGGKLLTFSQPLVMGILNLTHDSFYAASRVPDERSYLSRAGQMLSEGAAILDIGGQSTRPRATVLSAAEERKNVVPALRGILKRFPGTVISIDTYHSEVARAAVENGAVIVNDVSAGNLDPEMITTVAGLGVPYVAMHMQGTPATMQRQPLYEDVVQEILDFFIAKIYQCRAAGIRDIIADPGFGFGKTSAHNYTLLKHLSVFHLLEVPLLVGLSRKSMIWRLLEVPPEDALNGTTALHMLALQQGTQLLRVHDVKAARQAIRLWEYYRQQR